MSTVYTPDGCWLVMQVKIAFCVARRVTGLLTSVMATYMALMPV